MLQLGETKGSQGGVSRGGGWPPCLCHPGDRVPLQPEFENPSADACGPSSNTGLPVVGMGNDCVSSAGAPEDSCGVGERPACSRCSYTLAALTAAHRVSSLTPSELAFDTKATWAASGWPRVSPEV